MSRFLIIPCLDRIEESKRLANKYGFGFEYNDFFIPDVMDDEELTAQIIEKYKTAGVPDYCTMHGAFFDVLVFSYDKLIRKISEKRVKQSMEIAKRINVRGVVFHTNCEPFLTSESYKRNWLNANEQFWLKILDDYPNINVYIENMFDDSPKLLGVLAEKLSIKKNFGVCFDYAHASIYGSDIDSWVNVLSPYVKHMHINDNDLKNDLHLAVGDGLIDWEKFKYHYEKSLSHVNSVLIETSTIETQSRSAEFLAEKMIIGS